MVITAESALSSKTRWTIVGLLSASIAINLLDRQIFSVLAPLLRETFTWSNTQYGYAAVAFNLGMMLGQVPAGALMDRVGTKNGLLVIFLGWSLLTAAHALAGPGTAIDSIGSLFALPFVAIVAALTFTTAPVLAAGLSGFIFLRFLLGLFQCGNYTAGIKALAGLFPASSRSKAGGLFNAGAQLGSVIAGPLVLAWLVQGMGVSWQMAFVIPSIVCLLWLAPWMATFPDKARMTAIALKPTSRPQDRIRPPSASAAFQQSSGTRTGADPYLHRADHSLLLDVAGELPARFAGDWRPRHDLACRRPVGGGPEPVRHGRKRLWRNDDRLARAAHRLGRPRRKLGFVGAFSLGALSMTLPYVGSDALAGLAHGPGAVRQPVGRRHLHRHRRGRRAANPGRPRQRHRRPRR
jgi:MFS family permease